MELTRNEREVDDIRDCGNADSVPAAVYASGTATSDSSR